MDQLPRLGKRELICLLLLTCNYVVSVSRGFLFLWVLGMGYVILFVALFPEPSIKLFLKKVNTLSKNLCCLMSQIWQREITCPNVP